MSTAATEATVPSTATPIPASTNPWGKAPAWGGQAGSPWGKTSAAAPCSLEDVMSEELSEELAMKLQKDEEDAIKIKTQIPEAASLTDEGASCFPLESTDSESGADSDLLLAQMLQHQFDEEHDDMLRREEAKLNGTSKVTVSFTNHHQVHPALEDDEDDDELDEYYFENQYSPVKPPQFNRNGISGKGKNIVTKHDANVAGQENANRFMELPPCIATGDDLKIRMKLPNHVYNKLKVHSLQEHKRAKRLHEKKEHSTAEAVIDPKTRLILYKLVNGGGLDRMDGIIASGKESVVYHAAGGIMEDVMVPEECAVKVFRTTLSEFKNRCQYIKGDVRFFKDNFKKQNPRRIMKLWAAKEEYNLRRMQRHGLPCPRVVTLKKHVLVMSFIGNNSVPAPQLRDAKLGPADIQDAYDQLLKNMQRMYQECGLVHADLSEYNMLWHNDTLYFIDVAQAVERAHPFAHEFLLRDCQNVVDWFTRAGLVGGMDVHELFNFVTGLELKGEGAEFLCQIEDWEKNEIAIREEKSKDYAFEFFFDKAQKEHEDGKTRQASQDRVPEDGETAGEQSSDFTALPGVAEGLLESDSDESDEDWELLDKNPDLKEKLPVLELSHQQSSQSESNRQ